MGKDYVHSFQLENLRWTIRLLESEIHGLKITVEFIELNDSAGDEIIPDVAYAVTVNGKIEAEGTMPASAAPRELKRIIEQVVDRTGVTSLVQPRVRSMLDDIGNSPMRRMRRL